MVAFFERFDQITKMTGTPLDRLTDAAASQPQRPSREPTLCGDIDIRIARDGTWFYHGSPIGRKPLVKLFSTVLRLDENGDYWLQTPVEKARIRVEDAPFAALEMTVEGTGPEQVLSFRTNVDEWATASADHPIRVGRSVTGEPAPYVMIRDGLEALIVRSVFYDLVELATPSDSDPAVLGVWSGGEWFRLGSAESDT